MSGTLALGGFAIRDTRTTMLIRFLQKRVRQDRKIAVGFANHHFVTACQDLVATPLDDDKDFLLVNDGIGMQVAALLRFGQGFRENMNGTDFVPRFLRDGGLRTSVYLVGGNGEVVRRAAAMIAAMPHCTLAGYCDGFALWSREAVILRDIAEQRPDVLLVGLGNPLQEQWILRNWAHLDAKVIFGVGALFEWMTGTRRRAPTVVRRLHLEWAYRVALEPRRLIGRYTTEGLRFFSLVFGQWPALAGRERLGS